MSVVIVDYGAGNLGSIKNMLGKLGAEPLVASHPDEIAQASKLILPGVGAFEYGMGQLNSSGLRLALEDAALHRQVPTMGICLGMQMMTDRSEEGCLPGLGWVQAETVRFEARPEKRLRIPHMGWNTVQKRRTNGVLQYLDEDSRFYFVHSYYVRCALKEDMLLSTAYGDVFFDSAFQKGNIYGFQFHPEKSHRFGLALFKGFLEL